MWRWLRADQQVAEAPQVPPDLPTEDPLEDSETPEREVVQDDEASIPAEVTAADRDTEPAQAPATVLNLSRPPDWDAIIEDIPTPGPGLVFNPSLGEALELRERQRRRQTLVASRQAAVYGVADEDYTRAGALGRELKMKGGCVTLVEDKGVEEGQRWWASQCTETRQNRFTLPDIDYDALGRAVVD